MRKSRFAALLVSLILSLPERSLAVDRIDGFAKLKSGDTLLMRYTSGGCFHLFTYDLTFTPATVSVTAVRLELDGLGAGVAYRDAERRELGKLSLSDTDLAGLDALLAFYRTNSMAGCTTMDSIKISQIRDGKVIATEKFTDASCRARDVKGLLSIQSLASRLPKRDTK